MKGLKGARSIGVGWLSSDTVVRSLVLVTPLFLAIFILAVEVRFQRLVGDDNTPEMFERVERGQPWGGYAWRVMARAAGALWTRDPQLSERILRTASTRYPLESAQWLAMARIAVSQPDSRAYLADYLEKAIAVKPEDRSVLWQAAQLSIQAGDTGLAERLLRQWLDAHPADVGQAMFMARRWLADPNQLLARIVPKSEEHHIRAMTFAYQRKDAALADAIWRRAQPIRDLNHRIFRQQIALLLELGEVGSAVEIWTRLDPAYDGEGFVNGNFDRELGASGGFEWRTSNLPDSVVVRRDVEEYLNPPASLHIRFAGTENIRIFSPRIQVPVRPGQRYRLSGHWRGHGLTTRSLPYLHVHAGAGSTDTIPVPGATFDWAPWSFVIRVAEDTQLLTLSVQRQPTNAFDRNIAGDLWLDDIQLLALPSLSDAAEWQAEP